MEIIDIFYNDILKEAMDGKVDCYFSFNIHFYNNLMNYNDDGIVPVLNITNRELFNSLLISYVNKARNYYDLSKYEKSIDEDKEYNINKMIMTLLWSNATYEDFNDPISFLRKQIAFLDNDLFSEFVNGETIGYSEILGGEIKVQNIKESIMNETSNSIQIIFTDGNENYYFPRIRYGIDGEVCYIYALQNEIESDENIKKKTNRKLFKVNENFDSSKDNEEIYGVGNLKDVTSSFVVASNIFLGLLLEKGITKVEVPSILVERWIGKERLIADKGSSFERRGLDKEEYVNNEQEKHILIQSNLTEKFIRTFLRIISHHRGFNISSYPFDVDSSLHFDICENNECDNTLLNETFLIASGYKNKKL